LIGTVAAVLIATSAQPATFTIINSDGAGEGFNDATAVAPVGGNPGTTRGAQRFNVFLQAASIWGGIIPSAVPIRMSATFDPLTPCTATSAVLGSTGATAAAHDFAGAERPNTYYVVALASKLAGVDVGPGIDDMVSQYNTNVDNNTCLGTTNWYYGFDHNHGTNIDLLSVVLHEMAHGLGFASLVDETNGSYFGPPALPDIFTHYIFDDTQNLFWDQMSAAQRQASAINTGNLVWGGPSVDAHAYQFLAGVNVTSPALIAGPKQFGTGSFGPSLAGTNIVAQPIVLIQDTVAPTSDGCDPIVNGAALSGKIVLIDRGVCNFTAKTLAAQNNGAIAVLIGNNAAGDPPIMSGTDPSITIPTASITQADASAIKTALASGPVTATLGSAASPLAGTDAAGRPLLYAPNPVEPGSSVSHWDESATPNLLMEPFINPDLTSSIDLTHAALEDIGWFSRLVNVPTRGSILTLEGGSPNPFRVRTSIRFELARPGLTHMAIYDIGGRLVKMLNKSWMPAGAATIVWDATNDHGDRVRSGVYLCQVRINGETLSERVVVAD